MESLWKLLQGLKFKRYIPSIDNFQKDIFSKSQSHDQIMENISEMIEILTGIPRSSKQFLTFRLRVKSQIQPRYHFGKCEDIGYA